MKKTMKTQQGRELLSDFQLIFWSSERLNDPPLRKRTSDQALSGAN